MLFNKDIIFLKILFFKNNIIYLIIYKPFL